MSRSPVKVRYAKMMDRCYNLNCRDYARYGGRGITVCERWYKNYKNFKADMAPTFRAGLTLDRIDNQKGYSPDNCRWATMEQQQNNRTNNRLVEFGGEALTFAQWAKRLGFKPSTLYQRFHTYKWDINRCLTTLTKKRG